MSQAISIFSEMDEARSWCRANWIGTKELRRAGLPTCAAQNALRGRFERDWEKDYTAFLKVVAKLKAEKEASK